MAKQYGPVQLQGTIGEITFYRNADGTYGAKAKSSISKERIATDPAFVRTRENGREFGRAGKSGRLLRMAIKPVVTASDSRMVSRMQQAIMKCLKADRTNGPGERNVVDGDLSLMEGFDFNAKRRLTATLLAPYTTTINRAAGTLDVNVPPFVPEHLIAAPQNATHYKMMAAGAEVDFMGETYATTVAESGFLPIDNNLTAPLALHTTVTPMSSAPLFLALGVQFYQLVNGYHYRLDNGGYDAVGVVEVGR